MSERKTTEIKLRVSPDEKASWQLAAEQREVGLSQFIRECMEDALQIEQNQRLDSTSLANNAITMLDVDESQFKTLLMTIPPPSQGFEYISTRVDVSPPGGEDSSVAPDFWTEDVLYPSSDVPTSGEADLVDALGPVIAAEVSVIGSGVFDGVNHVAVDATPKPWTFEARKRD